MSLLHLKHQRSWLNTQCFVFHICLPMRKFFLKYCSFRWWRTDRDFFSWCFKTCGYQRIGLCQSLTRNIYLYSCFTNNKSFSKAVKSCIIQVWCNSSKSSYLAYCYWGFWYFCASKSCRWYWFTFDVIRENLKRWKRSLAFTRWLIALQDQILSSSLLIALGIA